MNHNSRFEVRLAFNLSKILFANSSIKIAQDGNWLFEKLPFQKKQEQ